MRSTAFSSPFSMPSRLMRKRTSRARVTELTILVLLDLKAALGIVELQLNYEARCVELFVYSCTLSVAYDQLLCANEVLHLATTVLEGNRAIACVEAHVVCIGVLVQHVN